jgi:hypothetical protein
MNGWTEERRQRQREAIKSWSPWISSTGPTSEKGKLKSSENSYKHGARSRDIIELEEIVNSIKEIQNNIIDTE